MELHDKKEVPEEEVVGNYRTNMLYIHHFKNGAGEYFTIASQNHNGVQDIIELEHSSSRPLRNKFKTTFTFIKERGNITGILREYYSSDLSI